GAGPDANAPAPEVRPGPCNVAGPPRAPLAAQAISRPFGGRGVRGQRRRGKGWGDPAPRGGRGRADDAHHPHRRADRRGKGAPVSLAVLATPAPSGELRRVRSVVVRTRAGRARGGLLFP